MNGTKAFGPFSFDFDRLELRKGGKPVRMKRRSAEVLAILLARQGEIVTRADIQDTVWQGRTVSFDDAINAAIRDIRRALDDDSRSPRYVETVAGRGYRFLPQKTAPKGHPVMRIAAGLVLLIIIAGSLIAYLRAPGSDPDAAPLPHVAVMPLAHGEDDDSTALARILDEGLISALGEATGEMAVVAPASIFPGMDGSTPLAEVSRRIRPDFIVAGSLLAVSEGYDLNLRLIRVDGYAHVWATTIRLAPGQDSLPDPGRVASAIAEEINRQALTPASGIATSGD